MSKPPQLNLSDAYWFQEGPGIRNWQFTTSGIKLLNVGNIEKSGRINLAKTDRHISLEEAHRKYKHFLCDEGDLVIASSGISIDDDGYLRTRGAFVESEHLPLCINTSTIRFKSINGNELRYLKHWLQSNEFRNQITKLVTGSAQLNFGPSHLKQLKVYLPPIAQQQRIAAILDKAAEIKTKREQAIAKLDELAQSTFKEIAKGASGFLNLKEIATFQSGGTPSKENSKFWGEDIAWISSADIVGDQIIYGRNSITKLGLSSSATSLATKGTILVVTRTGVGKVAIATKDTCYSQDIVSINLKPNFETNFIASAIKENKSNFLRQARGATIQGITKEVLGAASIPNLQLSEQRRFSDLLNAINFQRAKLINSAACFERLTNTLQHQAFTKGFDA